MDVFECSEDTTFCDFVVEERALMGSFVVVRGFDAGMVETSYRGWDTVCGFLGGGGYVVDWGAVG